MSMRITKRERVMWWCLLIYTILLCAICLIACRKGGSESVAVPRPVAYPRIDPAYDTVYTCAEPWLNIELNREADIDTLSGDERGSGGYSVRYARYGATLYCAYTIVPDQESLSSVLARRMERIFLDSGGEGAAADALRLDSRGKHGSGLVFYSLRDCLTPIHFVATDSARCVVSGTVVLDRIYNADSIAPVLDYLNCDIEHLVRNLSFMRRGR